jgi:acyl-CoA dehydrogenase
LIGTAFRLYDPEGLLGNRKDLGISLALCAAQQPGIGHRQTSSAVECAVSKRTPAGQDVFVPLDALIGGVDRPGMGCMLVELL